MQNFNQAIQQPRNFCGDKKDLGAKNKFISQIRQFIRWGMNCRLAVITAQTNEVRHKLKLKQGITTLKITTNR